jgi:ubiquinone/menaquinone biosynthesis C-methylase UbiE
MSIQQDTDQQESKLIHQFADFSNKRILEVGCGDGRLTWQYAKAARSIVGIDVDLDSLRLARADTPSDLQDRTHFLCAESEHIPFAKEKFDLAVLAWSL